MEKTKKQYQSEHTKEQIVNAVIQLLAKKGYGNSSISDISRETGLTKAALYHHFKNKEEIFYTTLSHIGDIIKRSLIENDSASESSVQRLGQLFDTFAELGENKNQYILIISSLVLEMGGVEGTFVQPLRDLFSELFYFVERIIVKGQTGKEINVDLDAKLLSLNIIGMLLGNTIPWILNRDKANYKAMMGTQKEILIRSLKNT
jgi:AcrR family transcriptional regulator